MHLIYKGIHKYLAFKTRIFVTLSNKLNHFSSAENTCIDKLNINLKTTTKSVNEIITI